MEGLLVDRRGELRAKVALDLSCCPLTTVSRRYPELGFSIVEKQDLESGSVVASVLVERSEWGDDFLEELRGADGVRSVQRLGETDDSLKTRLNLGCDTCFVRQLAETGGFVPDETAFSEGAMVLTFALESNDEFKDLLQRIDGSDAGTHQVIELSRGNEIDAGADDPVARSGITDRQLEILDFAYRNGYFDRSRRINIGEIAEQFDLHPSTVSSHLRVGMRKLLDQVL